MLFSNINFKFPDKDLCYPWYTTNNLIYRRCARESLQKKESSPPEYYASRLPHRTGYLGIFTSLYAVMLAHVNAMDFFLPAVVSR